MFIVSPNRGELLDYLQENNYRAYIPIGDSRFISPDNKYSYSNYLLQSRYVINKDYTIAYPVDNIFHIRKELNCYETDDGFTICLNSDDTLKKFMPHGMTPIKILDVLPIRRYPNKYLLVDKVPTLSNLLKKKIDWKQATSSKWIKNWIAFY